MSDEPQRSEATGEDAPPVLSQEFFLRVNDFIQMANRIERRHDRSKSVV